jgi:hypothetical protein
MRVKNIFNIIRCFDDGWRLIDVLILDTQTGWAGSVGVERVE